jgi:uncharacterized repeat protein (TIGR03803 family)
MYANIHKLGLRVFFITAACICFLPMITVGQSAHPPTIEILHSFTGGDDSQYPAGGLILGCMGNLYGTTQGRGSSPSAGSVFKINLTGEKTTLHTFGALPDAQAPLASLISDGAGNLYGTSLDGGSANAGTVFKLTRSDKETVLYSFLGGMNSPMPNDGANPRSKLVRDSAGNLYGTTVQGGGFGCNSFGCGIVFKISPSGTEIVLHSFASQPDGANPESGLVRDSAGNLYGTTFVGGENNFGTVYKLSPNGEETVLYSFTGKPDGAYPTGSLYIDAGGDLYGTTDGGGTSTFCNQGCGTIFKLSADGKELILHSFSGKADGLSPFAGLTRDKAGDFYGTTSGGGITPCQCGTVFKLSANRTFTTLHSFAGAPNDGALPYDGVILDAAGNLYGTTFFGGSDNFGTVFKLKP